MFPTGNSSVIAGRASRLEWAAWTGRRPVPVHRSPILNGGHSPDCSFARRAAVFVALSHVDEVALVETSVGPAVRGQGLGHQCRDSRLSALQDLLAIEIAPISHYRQLLAADRVSRQFRHGAELRPIVADVGD